MLHYLNTSINQNLTKRELRNKIRNNEYKRLDDNTINKEESKIEDLVKNPIIIKNNIKYKIVSEKILQKLILEDIESFMKEFGNSFSFIGSEYKIKIGSSYNYID